MKGMKANNKPFFQPVKSRMSARESADPIDDGGVIGELKGDKTIVEKLNELFTLILTTEEFWKVPIVAVFFAKDELEKLS